MTRPFPIRRRPSGRRRRGPSLTAVVIAVGVVLFVLLPLLRAGARVYVDYLWYQGVGRTDVFWGLRRAQFTMFAMAFGLFVLLGFANLFVADRLAPRQLLGTMHPLAARFHEVLGRRTRLVRYLATGVLALIVSIPASAKWELWLMYRRRRSFDTSDGQFGLDAGFYVFELPFLEFVLNWLFVALVVVTIIVAVTHVLNGGVAFASAMPTIRPATKAHLAVLLAAMAIVRAVSYWLSRYATTNDQRGFVQGATYAVVKAQLPALSALAIIAVITAGLFLWAARSGSWRFPLVASVVWIVVAVFGATVLPAAVQSLVVTGNQQAREATYLERNIAATREAMAIGDDDVDVRSISFGSLSGDDVEADVAPLSDVRLLNPTAFRSRFQVDQGSASGLSIDDLDIDRYDVDGEMRQTLVAARELDLDSIANQSWQGRHLISTHGCGVVMARTDSVMGSDSPIYETLASERPELYFSPAIDGYAIANTSESENTCDGEVSPYTGTAGVAMSSWFRRAAFAVAFLDYNVLGSGAINSDSQMLWVRDVRDRVAKLAPFLTIDGDPYPVVVDGVTSWVVDGYTSSNRFPYAQRIGNGVDLTAASNLDRNANYVRNSVKAVVDAYDGTVTFYVSDPDDPIIAAWADEFGGMFQPVAEMPASMRAHLRYPEDLFRVRTEMYSKYRLDASDFFERQGAWSVAQAPSAVPRVGATGSAATPAGSSTNASASDFASETDAARFVPYYTYFRDPDSGQRSFVLMRPFVPFSSDDARTELQGFALASNDVDDAGRLTVYELGGELPTGPLRVASQINSEPDISETITLQNQLDGGSAVSFGDLQLVPIAAGDGFGALWVRPFYVSVGNVIEYRMVAANYEGNSALGTSIGDALAQLFPGLDVDAGDRAGTSAPAPGPGDPARPPDGPEPSEPGTATPAELLTEADALLTAAEAALRDDGDLGAYQQAVRDAADLIDQALARLD